MSKLLIPNGMQELQRGVPAVNGCSNGLVPTAVEFSHTMQCLNMLLSWRGRVLGNYLAQVPFDTGSSVNYRTAAFALHTSPVCRKVRIVGVALPAGSARATNLDSFFQLELVTGLTGTGTSSTSSKSYASGTYATLSANQFYAFVQEIDVTPDTDYRLFIHQSNIYAVKSLIAYEVPRWSLDTAVDFCADSSTVMHMGMITNTQFKHLVDASEAAWRNQGPLVIWNGPPASYISKAATVDTNVFDGTTTATSSTQGFPIKIDYCGSLDSANVGACFWYEAGDFNATGAHTVSFRDQANNIVATISIPVADAIANKFYCASGFLTDASGATPTTKVDIYSKTTDAGDPVRIAAAGIYRFVLPDPRIAFTSATLALWFDASQETFTDGTAVGTWTDRSGNGLDATQGTAANKPTFKTHVYGQGKHCVRFDGTNDTLATASNALYKGADVTMVLVEKSTAGTAGLFCGVPYKSDGSSPFYDWKFARTAGNALDERIDSDTLTTGVDSTKIAGPSVWIYTTSDRKTYCNDGAFNDGTDRSVAYPNTTGFQIGGFDPIADYLTGDVMEILIFNGTLSAADIANVFAYANLKWQIQRA